MSVEAGPLHPVGWPVINIEIADIDILLALTERCDHWRTKGLGVAECEKCVDGRMLTPDAQKLAQLFAKKTAREAGSQ